MSDQRPGVPNSYGHRSPNVRTSSYSSTSHGYQQGQRPYGSAGHNSGASSFNASYPRRGGATEGRGRGQISRMHNEPDGRALQHIGGDVRRHSDATGSNHMLASLMEDAPRTKLSSYVTPHDAVQAQPAQHGATVVRSGSSATEGGSILFFSSVQKKGGAFTASERETYAQLHRSRAIPNVNRGRNAGNVMGSGVSAKSVTRQYAELEKDREALEIAQAKATVSGSKRSRFALDDSPSEEDEYAEEDDIGAEISTK
uniref:Uncharacterized protein n=1 Tax=Leishmania guyanensis TaxID=5670 RepID=A0A1E1ISH7_LEIGU|nr:hypothetical protein, conserved [Leishmania guyanensis]